MEAIAVGIRLTYYGTFYSFKMIKLNKRPSRLINYRKKADLWFHPKRLFRLMAKSLSIFYCEINFIDLKFYPTYGNLSIIKLIYGTPYKAFHFSNAFDIVY